QQAVSPQGDYARRVAQRGAVAKDVVINSMKPGKSYNAYANDVNLDWLANETGGNAYATVPEAPVEVGPLTPVWLPRRGKQPGEDDLLVAARLVRLGDRVVCQGVLIDWPTLRDELVREIKDLFPAAQLLAGRTATADALERTMTALPLQLDPSETRSIAAVGWSPLRTGVVIAWTAALAALVSAGLGGWSLWELSQRRIRFVSAVTHELRTPLTTLRLYLDMLTSGLVTDEERQSEYLQTLNAESDRLNRLITNVLEFSRLEGRRGNVQPRDVPIDALLADVEADWERRCRDAGKTLIVENALAGRTLLVDERLAQQILGILVDNACKYSRGAEDCRIWLRAASDGRGGAVFEVEDRGPGVPLAERRRVFQPFWRGRRDDAAAGGVGLGLTLAERWTSLLRGRLSVEPPRDASGACFRLQLPGLAEPTDSTSNFSPAAG
ncbi:MAG TPA: HAMP domain-containing sensor histidine kinase, partial [Pirellulales bacterium]